MKMMIKNTKFWVIAAIIAMASSGTVVAREDLAAQPSQQEIDRRFIARVASECTPPTARVNLDINNVRAMILRGNDMWWDQGGSSNARYEVPKLDDPSLPKKHSLFAGSIWIGGTDQNNVLKVAAQTYRQASVLGIGFWAGPLTLDSAVISLGECRKWDTHWKVERRQIQEHIAAIASGDPAYVLPNVFRDWPATGDVSIQQDVNMAPFVDTDGDGVYNPNAGDYPDIFGDQAIWFVTNDKGNTPGSGSTPLGMEIQTQAFAYQSNDELNSMTFYTNKIINRSTERLDSCFMAQWVDPDLGNPTDDFVGCDVPRGLGICFNGDDDDEGIQGYGANPPSVGVDFFEGPFSDPNDGIDNNRNGLVDEMIAVGCDPTPRTERIIMAKFLYFNNDGLPNGNPTTAEHAYNYMIGRWKDNTQMVYGGTGYPGSQGATNIPSAIMFPGASDNQYGWGIGGSVQNPIIPPFAWSEDNPGPGAQPNVPADRRFVQSAGPFTLLPGAVNFITIGVVWARASSGGARGSFNLLLRADSKAQALFDNCFQTIDGPDAPDVGITELDQELILSFSYAPTSNNFGLKYAEEDPIIKSLNEDLPAGTPLFDPFYRFEGFLVYQLAESNVSTGELEDPNRARLLYQGDIKNSVGKIINYDFDADINASVPFLAVDGADGGVDMSLRVTRDLFAEGSDRLVNFKRYYYLVVAYGYNNYAQYDPATDSGQQRAFLGGRNNVKTYTGIPHKWDPTFNGLILHSQYGDGPEITRIEGKGNGGNVIELTPASIEKILANGFDPNPTYLGGAGPVSVKVIDPTLVPRAKMILGMYMGNPTNTAPVNTGAKWYVVYNNDTIFSDTTIVVGTEQILGYYENNVIFRRLGLSASIRQSPNPGEEPTDGNGVLLSESGYEIPQRAWLSFIPDDPRFELFDWIKAGIPGGDPLVIEGDPQRFFENLCNETFPNTNITGGTWAPMRFAAPSATHPGVFNYNSGGGPFPVGFRSNWRLDSLKSVDIVITPDKSKWSRVVVLEMCEAIGQSEGGQRRNHMRLSASRDINGNIDGSESREGFSWFPGYAINLETGERLNICFGEDSRASIPNGRDMLWNPSDSLAGDPLVGQPDFMMGGKHFIYIMGTRYDGGETSWNVLNQTAAGAPNPRNLPVNILRNFYGAVQYTSIPLLRTGRTFLDNTYTARIRMSGRYGKFLSAGETARNNANPLYELNTAGLAPTKNDLATAQTALDLIRVVPNPYYAASRYEVSQLDNRVKITNLPQACVINIYTLGGSLIRTLRKDDPLTFIDWDLLNQERIPIASGMYIIHVNAPGIGEKVVKWFGVTRPIDLDTF